MFTYRLQWKRRTSKLLFFYMYVMCYIANASYNHFFVNWKKSWWFCCPPIVCQPFIFLGKLKWYFIVIEFLTTTFDVRDKLRLINRIELTAYNLFQGSWRLRQWSRCPSTLEPPLCAQVVARQTGARRRVGRRRPNRCSGGSADTRLPSCCTTPALQR